MRQVCASDLRNETADFPLYVVQEMCEEQVKQGNKFDPEVFARNLHACKYSDGFNWSYTEQGLITGKT